MIFIFQCSHEFAVGDETMHILSHYVRADAAKLCAKFPEWIQSHHEWVEAIANPALSKMFILFNYKMPFTLCGWDSR